MRVEEEEELAYSDNTTQTDPPSEDDSFDSEDDSDDDFGDLDEEMLDAQLIGLAMGQVVHTKKNFESTQILDFSSINYIC